MPDGSIVSALAFPSIPHVAPLAAHPDTKLLGLCQRYGELEREWDERAGPEFPIGATDADTAALKRITGKMKDTVQGIVSLGCGALEGLRAVAGMLRECDIVEDDPAEGHDVRLAGVIARSLLRGVDLAATTALTPPGDATLLTACAQFDLAERQFLAVFDKPGRTEADEDAAAHERLAALVPRMEAMPPRTEAGVQAVLRCLAAYNGEMACSFDAPGTVPHRLLQLVMRGTLGLAAPALPCPDVPLLAMVPEFERLLAVVRRANECPASGCDDPVFGEFDAFCLEIVTTPPATTRDGQAFQAAAAMHQLSYVMSEGDTEEGSLGGAGAAWRVLAGIVGDRYPLPGAATNAPASDTELLALQPEFEKLQAALEKNPARGGKKATQRRFD